MLGHNEIHITNASYLTHSDPVSASFLAIAALLLLPVCICNKVYSSVHVADCQEEVSAAQVTPKPATSFDANILSVAPEILLSAHFYTVPHLLSSS